MSHGSPTSGSLLTIHKCTVHKLIGRMMTLAGLVCEPSYLLLLIVMLSISKHTCVMTDMVITTSSTHDGTSLLIHKHIVMFMFTNSLTKIDTLETIVGGHSLVSHLANCVPTDARTCNMHHVQNPCFTVSVYSGLLSAECTHLSGLSVVVVRE